VPDEQVMMDLDACLAWAQTQGADASRVGVTGFCWGGRITWLYCMHNPRIKAGVAWYGRLEGQSTASTPRHPIELVSQLKAPVLGLYGEADTGIPVASVERMKLALAQASAQGNAAAKASQFVLYPEAPHAFHADYRPTYREKPAADGWSRALEWLKRNA
jgi:carboxymethylenebutenolidase